VEPAVLVLLAVPLTMATYSARAAAVALAVLVVRLHCRARWAYQQTPRCFPRVAQEELAERAPLLLIMVRSVVPAAMAALAESAGRSRLARPVVQFRLPAAEQLVRRVELAVQVVLAEADNTRLAVPAEMARSVARLEE